MYSLHLATFVLLALPTTRAPADSVPLYADLGKHHHEISTRVAKAQLSLRPGTEPGLRVE